MIDDQLVLRVERLRDEVELLKAKIRDVYKSKGRPVSSAELKKQASSIAERWLVEVAGDSSVVNSIGNDALAERSVHFQRLLTYSERNTLRSKYDQSLNAILKEFRAQIIVPLKSKRITANNRREEEKPIVNSPLRNAQIVFIGQSFITSDKAVNEFIFKFFSAFGLKVTTGEKPKADSVSKKVKERIEASNIFVGIFTRRDKLEGKPEWTTSSWVIDEKAYAFAKNKKLFLLKEQGVSSIGGVQGDYEYLEFDRNNMGDLIIRLLEMFLSEK
ncbi:MAG: hypothetical protein NTX65_02210 [Ignavibacteriales bacterium]|nr:hypothetical protein [Ignavibacteriales bacterium]